MKHLRKTVGGVVIGLVTIFGSAIAAMNVPATEIAWFTMLMGAIQFLTAIVITLVCFIVKGMMTAHKELAKEFKDFAQRYAEMTTDPRRIENHHTRLGTLEDSILIMGTELHAKGLINEAPKIAQGQGWSR